MAATSYTLSNATTIVVVSVPTKPVLTCTVTVDGTTTTLT